MPPRHQPKPKLKVTDTEACWRFQDAVAQHPARPSIELQMTQIEHITKNQQDLAQIWHEYGSEKLQSSLSQPIQQLLLDVMAVLTEAEAEAIGFQDLVTSKSHKRKHNWSAKYKACSETHTALLRLQHTIEFKSIALPTALQFIS